MSFPGSTVHRVTMVELRNGGGWQEVRPSSCHHGHPWTRPGSYRIAGHHHRTWQCATCSDIITGPPGHGRTVLYPAPIRFGR